MKHISNRPKDITLIITNEYDSHSDYMVEKFHDLNANVVRINTERYNTFISLDVSVSRDDFVGTVKISDSEIQFDVTSVKSVWWRRPVPANVPPHLSSQEKDFARAEIRAAFAGFWASLDAYYMSRPGCIADANYKIEQLARARKMGFNVPETLVTSDPENARSFIKAASNHVVYKVLTDPFLNYFVSSGPTFVDDQALGEMHSGIVPTTPIDEENIGLIDFVSQTPCLFQEYVDKAYELRVTVIGDQVFAAKIDSQSNENTKIDWRNYDVDIPYSKIEINSELRQLILKFVKSYGLNYSALDFIVKPDGEYVFLENNPNGQFMWVEDLVPELKMTDHLARCLTEGRNL